MADSGLPSGFERSKSVRDPGFVQFMEKTSSTKGANGSRLRPFKIVISSVFKVRYTLGSGQWGGRVLRGRFVPKAELGQIAIEGMNFTWAEVRQSAIYRYSVLLSVILDSAGR